MARKNSNRVVWVVLGVFGGGAALVAMGFVGLVALAAINPPHGKRIKLNNKSELYYTKEVSKADADQLVAFLNENYFQDSKPATVQLAKPNGKHQVRFVIDESKLDQTELPFMAMGYLMSMKLFDNQPLEVHLCDTKLKTIKTIDIKGKTETESAKK